MLHTQNSQQKSVPDLHVVTVAFLALKKMVFLKKKILPPQIFFLPFFNATFQCGRYNVFNFFFFAHEKLKKPPKKVAQNWPRPLFSMVQPRPQPTAQN